MVGRLVEDQQIRARQHHHGERHAGPLAAREGVGPTHDFVAGEAEATEVALDRPASPLGAEVADDLVQGLVERDLRHVLAIVGRRDRPPEPQLTCRRGIFPHQRLQKR
jgi:hypothetical protein